MIILIFGQPTSGKTTLSKNIVDNVEKNYGETYLIDGDDFRKFTKNNDYSKQGRYLNLKSAFDMALSYEKKGINVILSFVAPLKELRDYLDENTQREYVEIYLHNESNRGRRDYFVDYFELPTYFRLDNVFFQVTIKDKDKTDFRHKYCFVRTDNEDFNEIDIKNLIIKHVFDLKF